MILASSSSNNRPPEFSQIIYLQIYPIYVSLQMYRKIVQSYNFHRNVVINDGVYSKKERLL